MTNKEAAVSFLTLCAAGKARDAYAAHAASGMIHHNPWFQGDAASLLAGMEASGAANPGMVFEVKRAVAEGDLVAVHSRFVQSGKEGAVVHLLRFEAGRIAEFWDVVMPAPESSPNENGLF